MINGRVLGVLLAPAVAFGVGVWAEFADLSGALLFSVSIPVMIISTLCAASLLRATDRPVVIALLGIASGIAVFGIAESTHVAIHLARGQSLEFDVFDSEAAKAASLIAIHLLAGAMVGAGVGLALAAVSWVAGRLSNGGSSLTPTLRQAQGHPSPSPRERGPG